MKQYQIINAYAELAKLSENENMTEFDQWKIYKLRKALRPNIDFQNEREQAIYKKYGKLADEKGMLKPDNAYEYQRELYNLRNMDADIELTPIAIKLRRGITCKTIEELEGFVEFTEPEIDERK